MLTSKRDQGLAKIMHMIESSGEDEFYNFLIHNVLPDEIDEGADFRLKQYLVACLALIGAVDAIIAIRDKTE